MDPRLALIADIGGTNVRFALVGQDGVPSDAQVMACADFAGPAEAARAYLAAKAPGVVASKAAFAVASPITGDRIDLTNSPWSFSIAEVRRDLGLTVFEVVNDFTAVALSVRHLAPGDKIKMGGGDPAPMAPIAVLGPGTGLGVSALVPTPSGAWVALATEGGHVTMAAADDREAAILSVVRGRFGHISAERVLSGPGLVNLYDAVAAMHGKTAAYTAPDAITQRALEGSCPLCVEAVETFFVMLGTVAGNLALSLGARGGVYLAGGILPRLRQPFQASEFRTRFEEKGRFKAYLSPIPAWLVVHPQPAFAGLAGLVSEIAA